ncbi:MAG: ribosomal protein S18-alanine N-acetyltransferase [Acidimicrobiia bacterium]
MATAREPQPLTVHIVAMRRRYLRSVLNIENQVYPRPWTMSLFLSELGLRGTRAYFVAKIGRDVVGYAGLMVTVDEGHVTTIAVDPAWHRHQIGTRLLLAVSHEAIAREVDALTLEVRVSNTAAQAMYEQFGFSSVGVRKGYYAETNEDALVMWARDIRTQEYADRLARIADGVDGETILDPVRRW